MLTTNLSKLRLSMNAIALIFALFTAVSSTYGQVSNSILSIGDMNSKIQLNSNDYLLDMRAGEKFSHPVLPTQLSNSCF